jgi:ABC-type multidrug transport system fused ATPase/permease subunit
VAIVVLIATDPILATVGLALWPLLAVLNRFFGRLVEPPASRAQKKIGDVSAVVHESVDGALVVKTLGREDAEVERLAAEAEELRRERVLMGELRAKFEPAFEALPSLGIVALLALGTWRVSIGAITFGTLVQFVSLFQLLSLPMRLIGWFIMDLPRAVVGYTRLQEVFTTPVKVTGSRDPEPVPGGPLGIAADEVVYSYGGHKVLDGISFAVEANESVALVGPTGSGKSTLAQLLVRLDDPDAGTISAGGVDLRCAAQEELQREIAVVFQESFLFATSLRENIALGLDIDDAEIEAAARLARAHDFISALPEGYDSIVGERGVTLSGGQRQRVALARALVRKPRILILDDATSSVDPRVEAEILDSLRSDLDTTLIVIAYRVSTIRLAHRVLFLNEGRIVAEGAHDELLAFPGYEAMVRAYERSAA